MSPEAIIKALKAYNLASGTEEELQAAIAVALTNECIPFRREHRLSDADRIDFIVERVGIEVKVGGSTSALIRQVHRYAQSEELDAIVVVTTRGHHQIPKDEINGRQVIVHSLAMEKAF